jgi:acetyl-CoA carboxylase biotin carboxyl carrier protein
MKTKKAKTNISPAGGVNWDEVNRARAFMEQHGFDEFEFSQGGFTVRLRRPGAAGPPIQGMVAVPAGAGPAPHVHASVSAPGNPAPSPAEDLHLVKSPIVGTFYAAPNPQTPPYVKVGDKVKVGQVLCIIEAMKLMNEIESDVAGEVVKVVAVNAQPVEYGEPLFAIRASGK